MIMEPSSPAPAPMRQPLSAPSAVLAQAPQAVPTAPAPRVTRLLGERLELVEDLWKTVLLSECPPDQAERLLRLKRLSDPLEAAGGEIDTTAAIVQLDRKSVV